MIICFKRHNLCRIIYQPLFFKFFSDIRFDISLVRINVIDTVPSLCSQSQISIWIIKWCESKWARLDIIRKITNINRTTGFDTKVSNPFEFASVCQCGIIECFIQGRKFLQTINYFLSFGIRKVDIFSFRIYKLLTD